MVNFKKAVVVPAVAALALVGYVGMDAAAFAQDAATAGQTDKTFLSKRYRDTRSNRPLTVRRRVAAPVVAAAPAAPAVPGPGAIIGAPIGAAGAIAGLPFQVLGGVFPAGGPRKGGVTATRYVDAGKETSKIDEGWDNAVPVSANGPIFVVENGDPTVSPVTFIGGPIRAAGAVTQLPFKVINAGLGAPGAVLPGLGAPGL